MRLFLSNIHDFVAFGGVTVACNVAYLATVVASPHEWATLLLGVLVFAGRGYVREFVAFRELEVSPLAVL